MRTGKQVWEGMWERIRQGTRRRRRRDDSKKAIKGGREWETDLTGAGQGENSV